LNGGPGTCDVNRDGTVDAANCLAQSIQAAIGQGSWVKSSVSATLVYNTIDDMKNPHQGFFASLTTEFAGLGGNASWVKVTGRASYYHTLSEQLDLVGLVAVGGGHVQALGTPLRVFDLFQSNDRI